MRTYSVTILLFMMCLTHALGKYQKPLHVLKFNLVGTNIIVPIKVNNSSSLNFIFDTGIRHTIVTELEETDTLSLNYLREVPLSGLGEGEPITTYLSLKNTLVSNSLKLDSITVYALKENIFQLSKHLGSKINGMIGYDLIKDYAIRIDYTNKKIFFYAPDAIQVPKSFRKVPITIENQKPYLRASVYIKGEVRSVKLLVDTGAELALWLVNSSYKNYDIGHNSIYTFIGQGLNGEIFGNVSRIDKVTLAGYNFKRPIAAFPDSTAIESILANNERDGTIGSELLRRFHVVLNYNDTSMYLKKNSAFNHKFSYNTTGIEVVKPFQNLPLYEIAELWDKSPAAQAGLKVGDKIEYIDFTPVTKLSLIEVKEMLRKSSGKIRLLISRQEDTELIRKKISFKTYKL